MKNNPRENALNLDDSRSFRNIANQDKSRQEDSNASLLNATEPLRLNTNEDASYARVRQSSRPSIQRGNRKSSPVSNEPKEPNSRLDNTRNQDNNSPCSRNSIDSPTKISSHDSNILARISSDSRRDYGIDLTKQLSTPVGFGEVDNMINQATQQIEGEAKKKGLRRPVDLEEYTVQDFMEEQDVVHSLRIKNRNSKKNTENLNEEESKDDSQIGGKDRARYSKAYQRVSEKLKLRNGGQLEISTENENNSLKRENANADGNTDLLPQGIMSFKRPYSELVEVSSDTGRNDNAQENQARNDNVSGQSPPSQEQQNLAVGATSTTATATTVPQGPGRAIVHRVIATPYIQRKIALFLTTLLSSVFLIVRLHDLFNTELVVIPAYAYLLYVVYQKGKAAYRTQGLAHWYRLENKLEFFNYLSYILSLLIFNLRIGEVMSASIIGVAPLLLTSVYYAFKTEVPTKEKRTNMVLDFLIIFQALLLALKLDFITDMEWAYSLIICLMYFGTTISTCFIQIFYAVFLIYLIRAEDYHDRAFTRPELFLGILWQWLYFGLGCVGALVVIGIIVLYDPHGGIGLLHASAWIGLVLSTILAIFTIKFYKFLIKFRMYFNPDRLMGIVEPEPAPKPIIKFEVEHKKTYFINLSSTYFIPLSKDLLTKNKPDIEKIKNMFKDSKLGKTITSRHENKLSVREFRSPVNRETLHRYKEALDGKFNDVLNTSQKPAQLTTATAAIHKFLKIFSPRNDPRSPKPIIERPFGEFDDNNDRHDLCLSVDNIRDIENAYASPKHNTNREDEKLCYLCYANVPDCVLMNCGHGGICYECALAAVKMKNECVECRAKVEAIHKIDPESKVAGVVKGIEVSKVIVENVAA